MAIERERERRTIGGAVLGSAIDFFDLFERAGTNNVIAAGLLVELLREFPDQSGLAAEIRDCEHAGDEVTHEVMQRLNVERVTPIAREDILILASALDDIVDYVEEVADYLGLYKIEAPMEQAQQMAEVLHAATIQLARAIPRIRGFKDTGEQTVEVHRLENVGDQIVREAIASLFEYGTDPMVVIRWKDIFERLESAIDATERAAYIVEGIVIKNS
jgi:predicted phosphate transport protein (TIGR00153 family)